MIDITHTLSLHQLLGCHLGHNPPEESLYGILLSSCLSFSIHELVTLIIVFQ